MCTEFRPTSVEMGSPSERMRMGGERDFKLINQSVCTEIAILLGAGCSDVGPLRSSI